ncbi:DUF3027 domain-containing protein, partial [Frankia sp. CpI1-P]|uniref:DUF3027 domain-containing protein n=1 Tax=Frankia sp. CpI1-P TaxID=1502734 RepID=UPI0037BF03C9
MAGATAQGSAEVPDVTTVTTAPATDLDAPTPRTRPRASSATTAAPPPDVSLATEAVADPAVPAARPRAVRASREPAVDAVCAAAVDLARAAAVEQAGGEGEVGEHLGIEAEGDRIVLHRFACTSPAYPGWAWTVVVTRASRVRKVTVDDVVLMPGEGALLAPAWVPWSQRLRPGDVGVGDLLPTAIDDPRLALRVEDVEELIDVDDYFELGLGRSRVLSVTG